MSRHFNYELDERRIKILLSENRMSFSEDVWNEFVQKTKPIEKVSKLPSFHMNFAVNRSVLLTGAFIVLIGSFTLLVAKFVDFSSTKSNTETLREVKPDADNYKLQKIATVLPKKEEVKPTATVAEQTMTLNTVSVPTATTQHYASASTNTYVPATNTQTFANASGSQGSTLARTTPDTITGAKDSISVTQNANNQSRNRRKKKKEVEVMETKPLTTGLPTTKPEEQEEPELKLD